jgi:serine/threonine protein kinase
MSYKEVRELGRGGFGRVTEVVNAAGQRFAKKEFLPSPDLQNAVARGAVNIDDLKKRFFKEVKYQSQISSANVAKVIDSDLISSTPWYIMELAVGTLQDDLNNDRTLGANLNSALFDILSGLEAIHDLGITHRDLKPVNVLKFYNPDYSARYAISDFGLMTAIASDTTTITQTGHAGGTPIYAAPELITNFKFATATADIYSFGAILHDIFSGMPRTPYLELTVPGAFRNIVEKCTKRNPARRYPNVGQLRADVFDALKTPSFYFGSSEESDLVVSLKEKNALDDDEWDRLFALLERNSSQWQTTYNIFRAIREDHINSLRASSAELLNALGMRFSEYVRNTSHDFDYCDVLADKLENFFNVGNVSLQAHVALTLLIMGVSHNRWFVERKFLKLCSAVLDNRVASRILLDTKVEEIPLARYLSDWERSINSSRHYLHPMLASVA